MSKHWTARVVVYLANGLTIGPVTVHVRAPDQATANQKVRAYVLDGVLETAGDAAHIVIEDLDTPPSA